MSERPFDGEPMVDVLKDVINALTAISSALQQIEARVRYLENER